MTKRRRLLMIAYYFPPMGMGGVQRPLKFAKYLPECGWDVTVVTAQPDDSLARDDTLLADISSAVNVFRIKSFDPARLVRRGRSTAGQTAPSPESSSLSRQFREWSRWPDAKLHFARVATRTALQLMEQRQFDAIYTTSPPPSVHFAGMRLQKQTGLPWIADFRDPWSVRADDWGPTVLHRRYAQRLRDRILGEADHVLVMNEMVANHFRKAGPIDHLTIIPNGYDDDDFTDDSADRGDTDFVLAFYGTICPETDIGVVLEVIDAFNAENPQRRVCIRHIGQVMRRNLAPHPDVESTGYLPHRDAIKQLCSADAVALTLDSDPGLRMTIPGRAYEALRSQRPIIVFAPGTSTFRGMMNAFDGIWPCETDDVSCGVNALTEIQQRERRAPARSLESVALLNRKSQTSQLAGILNDLVAGVRQDKGER